MILLTKEEKEKYLGFDDTWFMIIGIFLISLFVPFAFFSHSLVGITLPQLGLRCIDSMCHSIVYWVGIRTFIIWIRKSMPRFEQTRRRIYFVILFVIFYCGIGSVLVAQITDAFVPDWVETIPGQGFTASYFMSFSLLQSMSPSICTIKMEKIY